MNILSLIIFATGLIWAVLKKKEMLDSVSECAYIMPHWAFSVWMALTAIILLPFLIERLSEDWQFLGFLAVVGALIVAASGYYKTEAKTLHYVGGSLAFVMAQIVATITIPLLLLLWVPLIGVLLWKRPKEWLFYVEIIGYLMVLI